MYRDFYQSNGPALRGILLAGTLTATNQIKKLAIPRGGGNGDLHWLMQNQAIAMCVLGLIKITTKKGIYGGSAGARTQDLSRVKRA